MEREINTPAPIKNLRAWDISAGLLLLALGLAAARLIGADHILFNEDAVDFFLPAIHDLLRGDWQTALSRDTARGPGLALLIAACAALTGEVPLTFAVLAAAASLAALALSYLWLRTYLPRGSLIFGIVFTVFFARLMPFFGDLRSDPFWWLFVVTGIVSLTFPGNLNKRRLVAGGLSLGLSLAFRLPSALLPLAAILIICLRSRESGESFKSFAISCGWFFFGWLLPVVPLFGIIGGALGVKLYSYNIVNLVPELSAFAPQAKSLGGLMLTALSRSPASFLGTLLGQIFITGPLRVIQGLLGPSPLGPVLFIAGVITAPLVSKRGRIFELYVIAFLLWVPLSLVFFSERFYLPLLPLCGTLIFLPVELLLVKISSVIARPFKPIGQRYPKLTGISLNGLRIAPAALIALLLVAKSPAFFTNQFGQTQAGKKEIAALQELGFPLPLYAPLHYSPLYYARLTFGEDRVIAFEGDIKQPLAGSLISIDNLYWRYMGKEEIKQRLQEMNKKDFDFNLIYLDPLAPEVPDYFECARTSPVPVTTTSYMIDPEIVRFPLAATATATGDSLTTLTDGQHSALSLDNAAIAITLSRNADEPANRLWLLFDKPIAPVAGEIALYAGRIAAPRYKMNKELLYRLDGEELPLVVYRLPRFTGKYLTVVIEQQMADRAGSLVEVKLYNK